MKKKNKYYNEYVLTEQIPLKSSKRDDVLQWIYNIHVVEWCVTYLLKKPIDSEDTEDKIQDIYLFLAEKPQELWDELFAQGKYAISAYVAGLVHKQIKSSTSSIYNTYTKHKQIETIQDDLFWENYAELN